MAKRESPELVTITWGEGTREVLVRGPKGVAWIWLGDQGLHITFFELPGSKTLQEADDFESGKRKDFVEFGLGGVWTGTSRESQRVHSREISEGIGRPVRFEFSGLPKNPRDRLFEE